LTAGLLISLVATLSRLTGLLDSALWATVVGVAGTAFALAASWIVLRGAAMASRRIRLTTRGPLRGVWTAVGWCGSSRDQSRKFATVAIVLTTAAWIVLPAAVAIALAR
jgi:hypothetical protein